MQKIVTLEAEEAGGILHKWVALYIGIYAVNWVYPGVSLVSSKCAWRVDCYGDPSWRSVITSLLQ